MTGKKRYKRLVSSIDYYYCIDTNDGKGLTENDMLNRLNEQDERVKELEQFKLSIISFAECNENINSRTLNDLIELVDYDRE